MSLPNECKIGRMEDKSINPSLTHGRTRPVQTREEAKLSGGALSDLFGACRVGGRRSISSCPRQDTLVD